MYLYDIVMDSPICYHYGYRAIKTIHCEALCGDCSRFLYSNVVFLETGFDCGFDGIICYMIRSTNFWKWSNAKMNGATNTAKKKFSINTSLRYKIDPGTLQQAYEIKYLLFLAEFMRKVNCANSFCDVMTYWLLRVNVVILRGK